MPGDDKPLSMAETDYDQRTQARIAINRADRVEKEQASSGLIGDVLDSISGLFGYNKPAPYRDDRIAIDKPAIKLKTNISVDQVIPAHLLKQLNVPGANSILLGNGIKAYYDNENNNYGFYNTDTQRSEILYLSDDRKAIKEILCSRAALDDIVRAGGLNKSIYRELNQARADQLLKKEEDNERLLKLLQSGDLTQLQSCFSYPGNRSNTEVPLQGDAIIVNLKTNQNKQGLYTFGAADCSVLVLSNGPKDGLPEKIAMAHIDKAVAQEDIEYLIDLMGDPKTVQAYVISGEKDRAFCVAKALAEKGVSIKFANADIRGNRIDRVAIDRKGQIYHDDDPNSVGRSDLNYMDPSRAISLPHERWLAGMVTSKQRRFGIQRTLNIKIVN